MRKKRMTFPEKDSLHNIRQPVMMNDTGNRYNGNSSDGITDVVFEGLRKDMGLDLCLKSVVEEFKGHS